MKYSAIVTKSVTKYIHKYTQRWNMDSASMQSTLFATLTKKKDYSIYLDIRYRRTKTNTKSGCHKVQPTFKYTEY